MVKRNSQMAFTMIELIFAIVIIAITVVSLPMMMQVNTKGMDNNLAQEAIFAASVELMQATTGYWDATSMNDIALSNYSRVINISGDCNSITKLRPGHIAQPFHRRCIEDTTITSPSNITGNSLYKTLNDLEHTSQKLYIGNASRSGYKNTNLTISLSVSVDADTNIKILTATVKDPTDNNKIVTKLSTQSANVGEPQYYKRMF